MAVQQWGAPTSTADVITSGMSSLANGARVASGTISNGTDRYTHMAVELQLGHATNVFAANPSAGAFFSLFAVPNMTGTALDGSTSVAPTADLFIGSIAVRGSTTMTAMRVGTFNLEIPPFDFTLLVQNNTGQALNSSLTTQVVRVRRYSLEVV